MVLCVDLISSLNCGYKRVYVCVCLCTTVEANFDGKYNWISIHLLSSILSVWLIIVIERQFKNLRNILCHFCVFIIYNILTNINIYNYIYIFIDRLSIETSIVVMGFLTIFVLISTLLNPVQFLISLTMRWFMF